MSALLRTAVGIAALAVAACAGGTASVAGKVTYQGKPVVYGSVVVIGADGVPKSGAIQPDGTYRVAGVKVGAARVAVSSPRPPGMAPGGKKARAGRDADDERRPADADATVSPEVAKGWFPLPEKYGDHARSGLTADVGGGRPADLELK